MSMAFPNSYAIIKDRHTRGSIHNPFVLIVTNGNVVPHSFPVVRERHTRDYSQSVLVNLFPHIITPICTMALHFDMQ